MSIILPRRTFLTGLVSALAAPMIVKPENIMPVKFVDYWNTRYLVAYDIGTDRLALRIDRALHYLPMPKHGVYSIPNMNAIERIVPKSLIQSIRPEEGKQTHITTYLNGKQLHELGLII
jgi:hypothetical protein